MSRIGKRIIEIPDKVEAKVDPSMVTIKGPKGVLTRSYDSRIKITLEEKTIKFERSSNEPKVRALHGLYQALVSNMVVGVTNGWEKNLELSGVGFRAAKEGKKLVLQLGHSHPIELEAPEGIDFTVEGGTKIKVTGPDKEKVGLVAANIRSMREVEPYKGKGVKYQGEVVRRKAGKAAKAAGAAAG